MINEERLRLMTKTAILEKKSKKEFDIDRFYKRDFISYHVILVWISVTIAFLMVAGGIALVFIERFPEQAQSMDLGLVIFTLLMIYVIFIFTYIIISMIVYSRRYDRATSVIKKYSSSLRQLEKCYEREQGSEANAEGHNNQHEKKKGNVKKTTDKKAAVSGRKASGKAKSAKAKKGVKKS